jgi:hypothetical protein
LNSIHPLERFAARLRARMLDSFSTVGQSGSSPTQLSKTLSNQGHSAVTMWADREFNEFACELFRLQHGCNQAYRIFCQSRGAIAKTVVDWSEIPAVPAAAFKERNFSCLPDSERTTVFFSSGTTGQRPSRHYHGRNSLEVYETSLRQWFYAHFQPHTNNGQHAFTSGLSLTPTKFEAPNSSLVHMFETLREDGVAKNFKYTGQVGPDGAWLLDVEASARWLKMAIDAKEPVLLLGTAFSYVHLLDYLAERNIFLQLPAGSAILETGGYKGRTRVLSKHDLHDLLRLRLGIPGSRIVCEYGMSELSSQAYDLRLSTLIELAAGSAQEPRRVFHFPPWARAQIVSPENGHEVAEGETGLIRVFDLANVYSAIGIQTEDLAVRRTEGFELLGRAALSESRGCSLMTA